MRGQSTGNSEKSDHLFQLSTHLNDLLDDIHLPPDGRFHAEVIKAAHSLWKKRLTDMFTGKTKLTPADISDHRSCQFGQWYFNEGTQQFGHLAVFKAIDPYHAQVHSQARNITRLWNEGAQDQAYDAFQTFSELTETLFEHLGRLEQESLNIKPQAL